MRQTGRGAWVESNVDGSGSKGRNVVVNILNLQVECTHALQHQLRMVQNLLGRRTVHWVKAQTFRHKVRYTFHVRRIWHTTCSKDTFIEWFARKALEFLGST